MGKGLCLGIRPPGTGQHDADPNGALLIIRHRIYGHDHLGEDSQFHRQHGFYVHGVPIEAATLASGWQQRAVRVQNSNTREFIGWCLEAHDLAASKLAAFREKDRDFVRVLLVNGMVTPRKLIARLRRLPLDVKHREQLVRWVDKTVHEEG